MKKSLFPIFVLILLSCLAPAVLADHLSDRDIAKGKPDAALSGVNVYHSTIKQAIARLGPPTKVIVDPISAQGEGGGREFIWQRGKVKLQLGIQYQDWQDKKYGSIPISAELWGTKPEGRLGQTGRGLRLGAKLADVRRIYGSRFFKATNDDGTLQVTITWEDETSLDLFFDKDGNLNHMHLLACCP